MLFEDKLLQEIGLPHKIENIKTGEHTIHCCSFGSGPVIVLLHGATVGWVQWHSLIKKLAKKFTVIALDLPGCGQSSPVDFKTASLDIDFVEAIAQLLKIKNIDSYALVGHSFGGCVALALSIKYKINITRMVLLNPLGFFDYLPFFGRLLSSFLFVKFLLMTVASPTYKNIKNFLYSGAHKKIELPEALVGYVFESVQKNPLSHPLHLMHGFSNKGRIKKEFVLTKDIKNIESPTLILSGKHDNLLPFDILQPFFKMLPRAIIKPYHNSGHLPFFEEKDKTEEEIMIFFTK